MSWIRDLRGEGAALAKAHIKLCSGAVALNLALAIVNGWNCAHIIAHRLPRWILLVAIGAGCVNLSAGYLLYRNRQKWIRIRKGYEVLEGIQKEIQELERIASL